MGIAVAVGVAVLAFVLWLAAERAKRRNHPVSGGLHPDRNVPFTAEFELYGNGFSHCSRKVRLVLAELVVPYVHHSIDLIETGAYGTISPAYLAVNPAGLIPTLVHRGHPVFESDDILEYVMAAAGDGTVQLVPRAVDAAREMREWLQFLSLSSSDPTGSPEKRAGACIAVLTLPLFNVAIGNVALARIVEGLLFHPDKKRPGMFVVMKLSGARMFRAAGFRKLLRRHRDLMAEHLLRLDGVLATRNWLVGDAMSLADISLACLLLRLDEAGWLAHFCGGGKLLNVQRYYRGWTERAGWHEAIEGYRQPAMEKAVEELRNLLARDEQVRDCMFGA